MNNKKSIFLFVLILVFTLGFLAWENRGESGTAEQVLMDNIGWSYEDFRQIIEIVKVNDDRDILCLFETADKPAVAYLNCVGENEYKYGIATEFYSLSDNYDISNIKAGDSDLLIKFALTTDSTEVSESKEKYPFTLSGEKAALHIISIENKSCFGYEYYIEPTEA